MTLIFNRKILNKRRSHLRKSQTAAENRIWSRVRRKQLLGYKFFRQFSIGNYIVDFYCPKKRLVIELDGSQHLDPVIQQYDIKRNKYLNDLGLKILRFWDNDVLARTDSVLEEIINNLNTDL